MTTTDDGMAAMKLAASLTKPDAAPAADPAGSDLALAERIAEPLATAGPGSLAATEAKASLDLISRAVAAAQADAERQYRAALAWLESRPTRYLRKHDPATAEAAA